MSSTWGSRCGGRSGPAPSRVATERRPGSGGFAARRSWTLGAGQPSAAAIGVGVLLLLVGSATKLWAAVTLGSDAYYWRNFFTPTGPVAPATAGPYRFLRNPMYTVGYLQTYGLALLVGSRFGLILALFDQAAILVFYRRVEKPHFDKLDRQARTAQNQASPIRSHDP